MANIIGNFKEAYTSNATRAQRAKNVKTRMNKSMTELNNGFGRVKTVGLSLGQTVK